MTTVAVLGIGRMGNPAVHDPGRSLGAAAQDVPELPSEVILCDTIRRFKGLERPVIILVELSANDAKMLDRLLYVGGSRARQHLVVIGGSQVLTRLGGGPIILIGETTE
ncbi:MAG TPA: ATP-binding domain-containing protein [Candidatus Limnocylindrales bacterium]|nr:ATP-binding domain-containing protein [Candidatus Limnocylindrales bacterium]